MFASDGRVEEFDGEYPCRAKFEKHVAYHAAHGRAGNDGNAYDRTDDILP